MNTNDAFKMTTDYDVLNDSLFMYIIDDYEYNDSIELGDNFILDFDNNHVPVALEILNASKILKIEKFSLRHPFDFHMEIDITEDTITIEASFKVLFHQKEIDAPINLEIPNVTNIPDNQTQFEVATA